MHRPMPTRLLLALLFVADGAVSLPAIGASSSRRFLLLHGSGTTAGAFLNSPTKLGAKNFLNGVPCRTDANSALIPPNWLYTALDADSVDGGWYGKDFEGWEKSIVSIANTIESDQAVGLVGHEEGAVIAAAVAALSALGEGPPLKFAVLCGAAMPESGPVADLLQRLRDTPGASIPTLHCISESDPNCPPESAEELAKCFGDSAEILRHDSGVGMPPPSWWEETQAFPERVIGGNRWCTQFAGPFYYK